MATSLRTYERIAQALSSFSSLKRVNLWNERSVCDSKTSNRTLSNNNERAMDDGTKSSRPKSDLWFSRQKAKADEQWFEQFEKLKLYKDTHGDCMVPNSYTDDFSLRDWVKNQRFQYRALREGDPSRMTEERIKLLEQLGFQFCVPAARTGPKPKGGEPRAPKPMPEFIDIVRSKESRWNDRYQELKRFKEKFGHCIVPTKYKPNPSLGCWVSTQRVHYKRLKVGRHTALTQSKIERLTEIGFIWDASEITKEEKNNIRTVTTKKKVVGKRKKGKGDEDVTVPSKLPWVDMFRKLRAYKQEYGDTLVPSRFKDKALANWVVAQRRSFKAKGGTRLAQSRIDLLDDIDFVWDPSKSKKRNKGLKQANDSLDEDNEDEDSEGEPPRKKTTTSSF